MWICSSRLTAAVKDAENKSRKVLARSLLSIFYDVVQLAKKSLMDLDKDIVEACVGKLIKLSFSSKENNSNNYIILSIINVIYKWFKCVYFLFADFAMVAKLQNVPNVKRQKSDKHSVVIVFLRVKRGLVPFNSGQNSCKLNSLRFSKTKPGYYKGKPIYKI